MEILIHVECLKAKFFSFFFEVFTVLGNHFTDFDKCLWFFGEDNKPVVWCGTLVNIGRKFVLIKFCEKNCAHILFAILCNHFLCETWYYVVTFDNIVVAVSYFTRDHSFDSRLYRLGLFF